MQLELLFLKSSLAWTTWPENKNKNCKRLIVKREFLGLLDTISFINFKVHLKDQEANTRQIKMKITTCQCTHKISNDAQSIAKK